MSARARSLALVATCIGLALPQDPKPAGDTRLQIEVVDLDGHPVAGARVFTLPSEQVSSHYYKIFEEEDRRPQFFELVERFGARCETDETGTVVIDDDSAQALEVVAKASGLYAFLSPETRENPLRIVLERDREIVLVAIDADGRIAPGVEMVIAARSLSLSESFAQDPMYFTPGCAWIAETNSEGEAVVEHAQCIVRAGSESYVALGIPLRKRECVPLRGDALPEEPLVFQMPPTGKLVVEGPQQEKGTIHIRRVPDPSSGRPSMWSNFTPGRKRPREGKAVFPYVELGLQIEARAWWKELAIPLSTTAAGPTEPTRTATIRIEMPEWMANNDAEARIVATQGNDEVAVRWIALTAARSDNSLFRLCYALNDPAADPNRDIALHFQTWTSTLHSIHALEITQERHVCEAIPLEWVDRFASATGLDPAFYDGRPVSLATNFTTDKLAYEAGQNVRVKFELENRGAGVLAFEHDGPSDGASSKSPFRLVARCERRELLRLRFELPEGTNVAVTGVPLSERRRTLEPGRKTSDQTRLNTWFDLSTPGEYEVSVAYDVHLVDPLPIYASDTACPIVARECVDVVEGRLAFSIR